MKDTNPFKLMDSYRSTLIKKQFTWNLSFSLSVEKQVNVWLRVKSDGYQFGS